MSHPFPSIDTDALDRAHRLIALRNAIEEIDATLALLPPEAAGALEQRRADLLAEAQQLASAFILLPPGFTFTPYAVGHHGVIIRRGDHVQHYRRDRSGVVLATCLNDLGQHWLMLYGPEGASGNGLTGISAIHFELAPISEDFDLDVPAL